jgi:hypothetical protein
MTTTTTDTITRTENAATAYLPIIYTVTAAVALAYIINRWIRSRRIPRLLSAVFRLYRRFQSSPREA